MHGLAGSKRKHPGRVSLVVENCDPRGDLEQIGMRFVFPFETASEFPGSETTIPIGRSRANYVQLKELTVSKKHARMRIAGDRVTLCDLGSKHGSYLNDSFLEPNEEYALKSGDEICLGRLKLRYTAEQNNE